MEEEKNKNSEIDNIKIEEEKENKNNNDSQSNRYNIRRTYNELIPIVKEILKKGIRQRTLNILIKEILFIMKEIKQKIFMF